jgi:hypothetical protein
MEQHQIEKISEFIASCILLDADVTIESSVTKKNININISLPDPEFIKLKNNGLTQT